MPRKSKEEMRAEYLRKIADLDAKEKESDAKEATTLVADIAKIDEQIAKLQTRKDVKVNRLHELAEKGVQPMQLEIPVEAPAKPKLPGKALNEPKSDEPAA
jgi:flagellar biosynthesis chaperone FliJ